MVTTTDIETQTFGALNLFTDFQITALQNNGKLFNSGKNIPYAHIIDTHTKEEWLISALFKDNKSKAFGIYYKVGEKPILGEIDLSTWFKFEDKQPYLMNNLAFSTEYSIAVYEYVANKKGILITKEPGYEGDFRMARQHSL